MANAIVYRNDDGLAFNMIIVDPNDLIDLGPEFTVEVLPDQVVWDESTRPVIPENPTPEDLDAFGVAMQAWVESQPTPVVLPSIGWRKVDGEWVAPPPPPEPEPDPEV